MSLGRRSTWVAALVAATLACVLVGAPALAAPGAAIKDEPGSFPPPVLAPKGVKGIDVSAYQHGVDFSAVRKAGGRFAFIKATEGDDYINARLDDQYTDAAEAGLMRSAYHYAHPSLTSSGTSQAVYFVRSLLDLGGGRVTGTTTLPPVLDLESGSASMCWDLTPKQMVHWISDFTNTVANLTGRQPMIYTNANWWDACTGASKAFSSSKLYLARYFTDARSGPDALPAGWKSYTFWQYTNAGSRWALVTDGSAGDTAAWDENVYSGTVASLRKLARQ